MSAIVLCLLKDLGKISDSSSHRSSRLGDGLATSPSWTIPNPASPTSVWLVVASDIAMLIPEFDLVSHPHLELGERVLGESTLSCAVPNTFCAFDKGPTGGGGGDGAGFCLRPGIGNVNLPIVVAGPSVLVLRSKESFQRPRTAQPSSRRSGPC